MTPGESARPIRLDGCDLYFNGREPAIRLRPMESRLLAALLRRPNQYVSRATLMREVWQTGRPVAYAMGAWPAAGWSRGT